MSKKSILSELFEYPNDRKLIIKLFELSKHVVFQKEIIKFLDEHKDNLVPKLIFKYCSFSHTKGYRASLILLLNKYNFDDYLFDLLKLFLNDSYNSTWYSYDILKNKIKKLDSRRLLRIKGKMEMHIKTEKDLDKKNFHLLLLKKVDSTLKKLTN